MNQTKLRTCLAPGPKLYACRRGDPRCLQPRGTLLSPCPELRPGRPRRDPRTARRAPQAGRRMTPLARRDRGEGVKNHQQGSDVDRWGSLAFAALEIGEGGSQGEGGSNYQGEGVSKW